MSSTSEILNTKTFVAFKQLMESVRVCLGLLGQSGLMHLSVLVLELLCLPQHPIHETCMVMQF